MWIEICLLGVLALGMKGHGKKLYMFHMVFPIVGSVSKLGLYCVEILIQIQKISSNSGQK